MEGFEETSSHNYIAKTQMVAGLEHNADTDNKKNNKEVIGNVQNKTESNSKLEVVRVNSLMMKPNPIANLKPELKNKLKLDLTILRNPIQIKKDTRFRNAVSQDEAPIGFHEEFMSKLEEFSLSWRQAAMMERKI